MRNQNAYDYFTIEPSRYSEGEYIVYGWGIYSQSSVLSGQQRKVMLEEFETLGEAQKKYPKAEQTSFINPVLTTNHLPDYEMNAYEEENYWYDLDNPNDY